MLKEFRAKLQLLFSGQYGQFNIFFLTCCLFLLIGFVLANSFLGGIAQTVANFTFGLLAIALFVVAAVFFLRQSPRGSSEATPSVEASVSTGTVRVINPPDSFYETEHITTLLRFVMVGFDENLCPDGEVIGKVEEKNIRKLTEAEKQDFRTKHVEEIKQARIRAAKFLSERIQPAEKPASPSAKDSSS